MLCTMSVQTGTLPEQWSTWAQVGSFDLAHNQFSGTLPAAYLHAKLKNDPYRVPVTYWDFSNNR